MIDRSRQRDIDRALKLFNSGNFNEALELCKKILDSDGKSVVALNIMGVLADKKGQLEESVKFFKKAIEFEPQYVDSYSNAAHVLGKLGRFEEAIKICKKSLELNPNRPAAHNNLGVLYRAIGLSHESIGCYNKAIEQDPNYAEAFNNKANSLADLGKLDQAASSYQKALQLNRKSSASWSNFLYTINQISSIDWNEKLKEAKNFGEVFTAPHRLSAGPKIKNNQKLRIGLVSGDFREHPVGYFLESILTHLDKSKIELIAYPTNPTEDKLTRRIRPNFFEWKPLFQYSDEIAAEKIQHDRINILFDLSGHTQFNRLPIFAFRPAPIQVTWLGYFASTGMREVDYILGDHFLIPKQEEEHFVENVWRMPNSYLCFTPPSENVPVNELPAHTNGFVTFGCFNSMIKITPEVIAAWSKIMNSLPNSKLFLKTKVLVSQEVQRKIAKDFSQLGIKRSRLILEGWSPRGKLLESYQKVDIALDPFPYPGGTTSAESLWMGVPVLTMEGKNFLSRVGETIIRNAGYSNWVASSKDDYIKKAIKFSNDLVALSSLRLGMREAVLVSPLFNAKLFARNFEAAIETMWESLEKIN